MRIIRLLCLCSLTKKGTTQKRRSWEKGHHSNEMIGDPYHNQKGVSNQKGVTIHFYAGIFPKPLESRLIISMPFVLAVRRRRVRQKVFASPRHLR
jgi:hypothetical protein